MARLTAELELEVTVTLKTVNGLYGGEMYDKTVAKVEHKKVLIGTTDTNKRKLIEQVEDVMDQAYRETTKALHSASYLTDGAVEAKQNLD